MRNPPVAARSATRLPARLPARSPARSPAPSAPRGAAPSPHQRYAKSHQTRAQILAAALAEASEHGIHKTSVARIAARANTAVGSLHYHFGSRTSLLRELMRNLMADLLVRLSAEEAGQGSDFFERHRAELLAYLRYLRANPAHLRLADEIKFHEPEVYEQGVTDWVGQMAARIRAGIAEGSLRPMTETEIAAQAHFLVGARHFLEEMLEHGDATDDEAVVDAYLGLVRHGLKRPADQRP
jgi:AcrR family transcriptional regulator